MRGFMGTNGRLLMVHALQSSIHDGDKQAVCDIVDFCTLKRVILHITQTEVDLLIIKRDYEMMKLLIKSLVYI